MDHKARPDTTIRSANSHEVDWVIETLKGFNAPHVIAGGHYRDIRQSPILIAERAANREGVLCYRWEDPTTVEGLVIQVVTHSEGIGGALVQGMLKAARTSGAQRAIFHTTNDNIPAQRLQASIGSTLVHRDVGGFGKILRLMGHDPSTTQMIGQNGQPITDVLRYEKDLTKD